MNSYIPTIFCSCYTYKVYWYFRAKGGGKSTIIVLSDEPKQVFVSGVSAISAVSQAMCKTGAAIRGVPLYQYIASLRNEEVSGVYSVSAWLVPHQLITKSTGCATLNIR